MCVCDRVFAPRTRCRPSCPACAALTAFLDPPPASRLETLIIAPSTAACCTSRERARTSWRRTAGAETSGRPLSLLAPGKQKTYPFYIKDWLTPHFVCAAFTWLTTTAAVKEFPGPRRWLCLSGMSLCSSSRTGLWRFVLCWVSFKMFWMPCTRCRFQNDTFFDTKCFRTSLNNNKNYKPLICHFTCDSIQGFLHIDFVVSLSFAATSLAQMLHCALFHLSDVVPHFMLLWHDANKG